MFHVVIFVLFAAYLTRMTPREWSDNIGHAFMVHDDSFDDQEERFLALLALHGVSNIEVKATYDERSPEVVTVLPKDKQYRIMAILLNKICK